MLINVTNHPSTECAIQQIQVAQSTYGSIKDWAFPEIDPSWPMTKVARLAKNWAIQIGTYLQERESTIGSNAVLVMGEFTFAFALVGYLQKINVLCLSTTTARQVHSKGDTKVSQYQFVQFRPIVTH